MHIEMRSRLAAGKIRTALLLIIVPIAMLIPGSDVALSQTGTGTAAQPPLFTAIDLNPSGFVESWATGISEEQQVGYGYGPATGGYGHALLWHGTAASVVDLHPSGFMISRALGISDGQQVGVGISPQPGSSSHALLWRGTAASVVDLHPSGFVRSEASGISGGQQVGWGYGPATGGHRHALLWRGTAASVVDLHPSGFDVSEALGAFSEQQVGWGGSGDCNLPGGRGCPYRALLWLGTAGSAVDLGEGEAYGTSGQQQVGYGPHGNATLWNGSADSMVDLQPSRFYSLAGRSTASGITGGEQVGYGGPWPQAHALLWRGDKSSMVDLHDFLPPGFDGSNATGIDSNGDIVGFAWGPVTNNRSHAFLWTRNVKAIPSPVPPVDKFAPVDEFAAFSDHSAQGSLDVSSVDSVELLLTDPLGTQTGFDAATNTWLEDIPTASYTHEQYAPEKPVSKSIEIGYTLDGQYTLDVIGTGSGGFEIYVGMSDEAGNLINHKYSGTTAPGRITRLTFPGRIITFAAFGPTVKINLASKMFEVNGTFSLGPGIAISPVTRPVTVELYDLSLTIPAGSFRQDQRGAFVFEGTVAGVALEANLTSTGGTGYAFKIKGTKVDLVGGRLDNNPDPIRVILAIGNIAGNSDVKVEYVR